MQGLLVRLKQSRGENKPSNPETEVGYTISKNASENKSVPNGDIYVKSVGKDTNETTNGQHLPNGGQEDILEDDNFEIDLGMSSKNKPSDKYKSRNSITSTSSKNRKSLSRPGNSRLSMYSDVSEAELLLLSESDDESASQYQRSETPTPHQAWAAFEDAVKSIDSGNTEYFLKKPKPNFIASGTFQEVMVDMYGNTEFGNTKGYTLLKQKLGNMAKSSGLAARMLAKVVAKGQELREIEEPNDDCEQTVYEEPDGKTGEVQEDSESVTKVFAKRSWKALSKQVNDDNKEHISQAPPKFNLAMLQQTVQQMTNMERSRQDLYERYGIVPTTLPDGRVGCENIMLSERARAQLYGRTKDGIQYVRPKSYQPPSAQQRSRLNAERHTVGVSRTKSAKLAPRKSFRPLTAK
ncbi:hypothetical protein DPMN_082111 [Dreissena polymorpha]|uniref:Uncharacterized protein n=1 Tax=Dreissena polymorpha TaxID=45954 RepID=A0A9D3Y731_DREPO|nr:hypothetical protein DPMN_082111 [Dreissena polymorpha]